MTDYQTKKDHIEKIIEELGGLISIRISRYHHKFNGDDEVKFLNSFIICPDDDADGDILISYPQARKFHFDERLDIGLDHFELKNISLNKDMSSIIYSFAWLPVGLGNIDNPPFLEFQLTKDKINFPDPSAFIFFERLENSSLIDLLKGIKKSLRSEHYHLTRLVQSLYASLRR